MAIIFVGASAAAGCLLEARAGDSSLELIEDEARVRILEQSADAESAKRARKIKTACSPVCTGALSPSLPDCLVATDRPEPQPVSQFPAVAKLIHAENLRHICFICAINK